MSDSHRDPDLAQLAADLARSLRDLQRELEPQRSGRFPPAPPAPRDVLRFTDEVAIPAAILVLETNVRALKLLQRTIRLANDTDRSATADTPVRDRAVQLSEATLDRLDSALADVQSAIEGRPENDEARELLEEAQTLRDEIEDRLTTETPAETTSDEISNETNANDPPDADVPVDVDAELQSIRDQVEDGDGDGDSDSDNGNN